MNFSLTYPDLVSSNPVWVHGHRGSAGTRPENTLAAFKEGGEAGADLLELDLHLSADDTPVVFHDAFISARTCLNEKGRKVSRKIDIGSLPFKEIEKFDVGSRKPIRFRRWVASPGSRILSFEALCEWVAAFKRPMGLNVEIKTGKERRIDFFSGLVVETLEKFRLLGKSQLQSFSPLIVASLRKTAPKARVSLLLDRKGDWVGAARSVGADVIGPRHSLLTRAVIQKAHDNGIAVVPWTVNSVGAWKKCLSWGVDGIITDFPARLVDFLARAKK